MNTPCHGWCTFALVCISTHAHEHPKTTGGTSMDAMHVAALLQLPSVRVVMQYSTPRRLARALALGTVNAGLLQDATQPAGGAPVSSMPRVRPFAMVVGPCAPLCIQYTSNTHSQFWQRPPCSLSPKPPVCSVYTGVPVYLHASTAHLRCFLHVKPTLHAL